MPKVLPAFQERPSNMPDHYFIGLRVLAPPHAATPPHTHGGAAVAATMIRGRMINQMVCPHHEASSQGTGPQLHSAGESWYEPPGCHHVRSENPDDTEAEFIAVFVISKEKIDRDGLGSLVVIDNDVEDQTE
jgi:quercetin dioxygenase-like cupin family protein